MGAAVEYWRAWLWRAATTRVMTVCFALWIVVGAGWLLAPAGARMAWLGLWGVPAGVGELALRPWTPLTFMFVHLEFVHLAVNMLWWLMFGEIYEQMQGRERLMALYIYGGLAGAAAFIAWPFGGSLLIGASCSVMAVMGAVVVILPDHKVNLLLFGPVRILWVALVAVVFFVVMAPEWGESVAHGAALCVGVAAGWLRRRGVDVTRPLTWTFARVGALFSRTPVARVAAAPSAGAEEELDALLEKVSRSGYASLTPSERQRLFDLSQRFNHRR